MIILCGIFLYAHIYMSNYPHLSICQSIYLSIHLFVHLSILCGIFLNAHIYVQLYTSMYLSTIHLSIHPSIYLSIHPSIHISIYPWSLNIYLFHLYMFPYLQWKRQFHNLMVHGTMNTLTTISTVLFAITLSLNVRKSNVWK